MAYTIGSLLATLGLDVSDFTKGLNKAVGDLDNHITKFAQAGAGLSAAISLPLGFAVKTSLEAFSQFEAAMSRVQALGGDEFKPMLEDLSAAALDWGKKSRFSATEVADAMGELTAAGFSAKAVMESIPSVTRLAAIENMKLADATKIASSIMKGFGLSSAALEEAVDVLAKASAVSAISVKDLGSSFQYVGPIAKAVGVDFRDVAAALAVLGNQGIRGETGGTAIRNLLNDLQQMTPPLQKAFKQLGIEVRDTSGKFLPLSQILSNLRPLMENTQLATRIFGARVSEVYALISDPTAFTEARKNFEGLKGTAKEMADIMQNNLAGSWRKFQAALDTLAINFGKMLAPLAAQVVTFATSVVESVIRIVDWFGKLPTPFKAFVAAVVGGAALIGPALLGIAAAMKGMMIGKEFIASLEVGNTLMKLFGMEVEKAGGAALLFQKTLRLISFENIGASLSGVMNRITTAVSGAVLGVSKVISNIPSNIGNAFTSIATNIDKMGQYAKVAAATVTASLADAWLRVRTGVEAAAIAVSKFSIANTWNAMVTSLRAAAVAAWEYVAAMTAAAIANARLAFSNVVQGITSVATAFRTAGVASGIAAMGTALSSFAATLTGPLVTALTAVGGFIAGITAPVWATAAAIAAAVALIAGAIIVNWDKITVITKGLWEDLKQIASGITDGLFGEGSAKRIGQWVNSTIEFFKNLWSYMKGFFLWVGDKFTEFFGWLAKAANLTNTKKAVDSLQGDGVIDRSKLAPQVPLFGAAKDVDDTKKAAEALIAIVNKYSDAVSLGNTKWSEGNARVQQVAASMLQLQKQREKLTQDFKSNLISKGEYDAAIARIDEAMSRSRAFAAQFDENVGKAGVKVARTGEGIESMAKKVEKAFASVQRRIVDITDSIPQSMAAFQEKFLNPAQVQRQLEQLSEVARDALNGPVKLTAKMQQSIVDQTKKAQEELTRLAELSGMTIEGSITRAAEAWRLASQLGVDWVKDTIAQVDTLPAALQAAADKARQQLEKLRKELAAAGRQLTPEVDLRLENKTKDLEFGAKIGMPVTALEEAMKRVGAKTDDLRNKVRSLGTDGYGAMVTQATADLALLEKANEKTGGAIPLIINAVEKAQQALADAKIAQAVGANFGEIALAAARAGVSIKNVWKSAEDVASASFDKQAEDAQKAFDLIQKQVNVTGKGFDQLQLAANRVNLTKWQQENKKSFDELATVLQQAGINVEEFKKRIESGGNVFQVLAEQADKSYAAIAASGVATAQEIQEAWDKKFMANLSASFNRTSQQLEADFKQLGLSLEESLNRFNGAGFQRTVEQMSKNLEDFAQRGLLTVDQLLTGYLKIEQVKTQAAEAYFNTLQLGVNKTTEIFGAAWDVAVQKSKSATLEAVITMRKEISAATANAVESLFSFDSKKIAAAFTNLGQTALTQLKNVLITPFQTVFQTFIGNISDMLTKFVTEKIMGVLFTGLNAILGQIPALSSGFASIFGSAGSAKDITSLLRTTTEMAAKTATATANLAANAAKLGTATATMANAGADLSNAATQVTSAATQATNAATTATKTLSSALSSTLNVIGSVASIASAITGLFSFFSQRRMEKDIARIEESTRWTKGLLIEIRDILQKNPSAQGLSDVRHEIAVQGSQLFELLVDTRNQIVEQLRKVVDGISRINAAAAAPPKTETETPDTSTGAGTGTGRERDTVTDRNGRPVTAVTQLQDAATGAADAASKFTEAVTGSTTASQNATQTQTSNTTATEAETAAVAASTAAFNQIAATLPQWAQTFGDYIGKSSKDLNTYVSQFGSKLETSAQTFDNGTRRVVTDLKTGTRFLVDTFTDRVIRILDKTEYMSNTVMNEFVNVGDSAAATSSSLSDTSSSASQASKSLDDLAATGDKANTALSTVVQTVAAQFRAVGEMITGNANIAPPTTVETSPGQFSFTRIGPNGQIIQDYNPQNFNPNNISGTAPAPRMTSVGTLILQVPVTSPNSSPKETATAIVGVLRDAGVDM